MHVGGPSEGRAFPIQRAEMTHYYQRPDRIRCEWLKDEHAWSLKQIKDVNSSAQHFNREGSMICHKAGKMKPSDGRKTPFLRDAASESY